VLWSNSGLTGQLSCIVRAAASFCMPPSSIICAASPSIAEALHQTSHSKPFTLSQINLASTDLRQLLPDRSYRFRITALTQELTAALACFSPEAVPEFLLAGQPMELLGLSLSDAPWAASIPAAWLVNEWFNRVQPPPRRFGLRFCSPTMCQSSNPAHGLFPEPQLVFYGLAEKWLAFSASDADDWPPAINEFIEEAALGAGELLRVSRYNLTTAVEKFRSRDGAPPYQKIGYLSAIEYIAARHAGEAELRALGLLADYAFFAGIGYKTTMGMGQVQPLRFRS
jgi:CRISPR-associated endoribonuclease Cas6